MRLRSCRSSASPSNMRPQNSHPVVPAPAGWMSAPHMNNTRRVKLRHQIHQSKWNHSLTPKRWVNVQRPSPNYWGLLRAKLRVLGSKERQTNCNSQRRFPWRNHWSGQMMMFQGTLGAESKCSDMLGGKEKNHQNCTFVKQLQLGLPGPHSVSAPVRASDTWYRLSLALESESQVGIQLSNLTNCLPCKLGEPT